MGKYHKGIRIEGAEEFLLAVNITGHGAPTEDTEAEPGMCYLDEDSENGDLYKCIGMLVTETRTVYRWKKLAGQEEVERLEKAIEELDVQPDWNQNDETAKDYVKNRPFWTDDPAETEIFNHVFAEQGDFLAYIGLKSGEIYTVTASKNGVEQVYTCQCVEVYGVCALGNLSMNGMGENTREPFLVIDDSLHNESVWALATTGLSITMHGIASKIHPIPSEFLPAASDTENGVISVTKVKGLVVDNLGLNINVGSTTYAKLSKHLTKYALPRVLFKVSDTSSTDGTIYFDFMVMSRYRSVSTKYIYVLTGFDFQNGIISTVKIVFPLNAENSVDDNSVVEEITFSAPTYTILTAPNSEDKFRISVNTSGEITATKITTE